MCQKNRIRVHGYTNYVRIASPKIRQNSVKHFFCQELIDAWGIYTYRFGENPQYYSPVDAYFFRSEETDILAISDIFPNIHQDFFEAFRDDFLVSISENTLLNKVIVLNYLHL